MNKDLLPFSMIVLFIFLAQYIYSSDYKKPTKYATRSSQCLYVILEKDPVPTIEKKELLFVVKPLKKRNCFDRLLFMNDYFETRLPQNKSYFNTSIEDYFKNLEKNHSSLSLSNQNISNITFNPKITTLSKFSFASKTTLFHGPEKNHLHTWNKVLSLRDQ